VAMTASGARVVTLQPDRGAISEGQLRCWRRQALWQPANARGAVEHPAPAPGHTAASYPSTEREWVKPLNSAAAPTWPCVWCVGCRGIDAVRTLQMEGQTATPSTPAAVNCRAAPAARTLADYD
jgi:hypothetical protein